jgi:hypothetical protein
VAETTVKETFILRDSTDWESGGTSVPVLVEDMLRNKPYFQFRISHVSRFISIVSYF